MKNYQMVLRVRASRVTAVAREPAINADVIAIWTHDGLVYRCIEGTGLTTRMVPQVDDYVVVHPDGTIEALPKALFEERYTEVTE